MVLYMVPDPTIQIPKLRCSPFHSSLDADPIGSAASYDAYLCVEVPLPWKRDITMSEPFASLCEPPSASLRGADGRRWRPQGLVPLPPAGGHGEDGRVPVRVTTWEGRRSAAGNGQSVLGESDGAVGPLSRRDWSVDPDGVLDLLRAILSGAPGDLDPFERFRSRREDPALYLCTHGQRDVCCGSLGMELYGGLDDLGDGWGGELRRCSHTGGHRFAATGITFPDGYAWAHMNPRVADAIVNRRVPPRELAFHVRGSTLLPKGPAQVVDRLGLVETGWEWLDATRSIELVGFERRSMATDMRVGAVLEDGRRRVFEARVGIERHVPQITCGVITEPEYTVEPVWAVQDWREV